MRPIRGPRHAADDERTVEAPAEEPTLSAGLDVRAAFEAQDRTIPGAVVGLVPLDGPIEETSPGQQRTIPLVLPEAVRQMRAESQARLQAAPPRVALPPPSDPVLPPPSDPVLVSAPRGDPFAEGEEAVDIPGVGGAQRKRMLRIVIGVLSVCGLLCVGALARQLLGSKESSSSPIATATATESATESATPPATAAASVVATAEPSAPAPVPSAPPVVAAAAPEPVAATAAPAPPPPPARARAPEPPPPARRPAPAAPAAHPRAAAGPAAPKGRPPIVRDSPF